MQRPNPFLPSMSKLWSREPFLITTPYQWCIQSILLADSKMRHLHRTFETLQVFARNGLLPLYPGYGWDCQKYCALCVVLRNLVTRLLRTDFGHTGMFLGEIYNCLTGYVVQSLLLAKINTGEPQH